MSLSNCRLTVQTLLDQTQGGGQINTAYIERLNATFRARLAPLVRRGRALVQQQATLQVGVYLVGTVYNFCAYHTSLRLALIVPGRGRRWLRRTPLLRRVLRIIIGRLRNSYGSKYPSRHAYPSAAVGLLRPGWPIFPTGASSTVRCDATSLCPNEVKECFLWSNRRCENRSSKRDYQRWRALR